MHEAGDCRERSGPKVPFIRESERPVAAEAFEHARNIYDQITSESEVD
jgi:hypothetical protein